MKQESEQDAQTCEMGAGTGILEPKPPSMGAGVESTDMDGDDTIYASNSDE